MRNQFWIDVLGEDQTRSTQGKDKTQYLEMIGDAEGNASAAQDDEVRQHHARDLFAPDPAALPSNADGYDEKARQVVPVDGSVLTAQPDTFSFEGRSRSAWQTGTGDLALPSFAEAQTVGGYAGTAAYDVYDDDFEVTKSTYASGGSSMPGYGIWMSCTIEGDKHVALVIEDVDYSRDWFYEYIHYLEVNYHSNIKGISNLRTYHNYNEFFVGKNTYAAKITFGSKYDYLRIDDRDTDFAIQAEMGAGDDWLRSENASEMPFAYFDLGDGDDHAVICGTSSKPANNDNYYLWNVIIKGGNGNDNIAYEKGGNAMVFGEDGNDFLTFSFGDGWRSGIVDAWGGEGHDTFMSMALTGKDIIVESAAPDSDWNLITFAYALQDVIGSVPGAGLLTMGMRQLIRVGEYVLHGGNHGHDYSFHADTKTYLQVCDFDPREDSFVQWFENQNSHKGSYSFSVVGSPTQYLGIYLGGHTVAEIRLDNDVVPEISKIAHEHGQSLRPGDAGYFAAEMALLNSILASGIYYMKEYDVFKFWSEGQSFAEAKQINGDSSFMESFRESGVYDSWNNLYKSMYNGDFVASFGNSGIIQGGGGYSGYSIALGTEQSDIIYAGKRVGLDPTHDIDDDPKKSDVFGLGGHDRIFGSRGEDRIYAGSGDDMIDGGRGDDLIYGDAGNDIIHGGDGNDIIYGGGTKAADGQSSIMGPALFDRDTIYGGAGDDFIYGELGNDTINGGTGDDSLYGGSESDTFVFEAMFGHDKILDFALSKDKIDLSQIAELDSWNELQSHLYYNPADEDLGYCAVIKAGENEIDIALAAGQQLAESDFIFA
ncbi:calcium-binding protein [Martelella radicis]|uniref:Calcium-binding protein n=1 Tax=Martelella radicis TaxID=1397476 RepID=A0A7W6KKK6_9HYPH|nr:calcium-binding protein [Martelella radicis]MBB4121864.1 hypothetical protein [Martelella radicis]